MKKWKKYDTSLTPSGLEIFDGEKWLKLPCVIGNVTFVKRKMK